MAVSSGAAVDLAHAASIACKRACQDVLTSIAKHSTAPRRACLDGEGCDTTGTPFRSGRAEIDGWTGRQTKCSTRPKEPRGRAMAHLHYLHHLRPQLLRLQTMERPAADRHYRQSVGHRRRYRRHFEHP